MALQTNKVKVQKIDMNRPSYNKAASGDNGLDAIIKNSVSYTNANQALKIFNAFLKTYEFNASSYDKWVEAVDEFIEALSIAIRDGYDGIDGTKEEPDLSSLKVKMLATLSPTFKDQTPQNRTSKYDDVTIRSIVNYYKPSGDTQEQVSLIKASDVLIGKTNVYSQKDEVVVPNKADDIVYSRASSSGINMSMATSPSKLVCIADEVYDASGAVIEEAETETEYDDEQEDLNVLSRMQELYSDKEVPDEPIDMNVRTPVATSQDVLVPVSNNYFVSSSDIVKSEEIADIKDVKEQMDDTLVHDDTVALDSGNADETEGRWVEDHNIKIIKSKAGTEWRVVWDKDPVRMAEETPIPFDPSVFAGDGSVSKTEYDYGMKIVELPPVGVDMDSFGKAFEFIVYSRIDTVSSLSSNATIEGHVPPAGQNAVGFYYNRHAARSLNFSFKLAQQEYPELPLSYIAEKLQELSRPYQYNDLHVEPKRCEIFLPGMSFQGYINTVSCTLTGDLYTSWNDKPPVENTTGEQYSYGLLNVTMNFMIEEDIPLKQVKTDEKYALPVPDLPPSVEVEEASTVLNNALEQLSLIGNPDKELLGNLFKPATDFRVKDMQDVRVWFKDLQGMIRANLDKMDTLDEDLSNIQNPNELQQFFIADKNSEGFLSQAILFFNALEYSYSERSFVDAFKGLVFGMENGEKNFADVTLLTDPGILKLTSSNYNFEDLFGDDYTKFKGVMPFANDFVDMKDYSAWAEALKAYGFYVQSVIMLPGAVVLAAIVTVSAIAQVAGIVLIIEAMISITNILRRLFGLEDRNGQFPFDYFVKAIDKLKSDDKVYGFLERVEFMRPYFRKINFPVKGDALKRCLEGTKITLAENMMILEDGTQRVAFDSDSHLLVHPHLMYLTLAYKALGRTLAETLNNSEHNLSDLAQNTLVAQIKAGNKGYGVSDDVEKIHKELTNNGADEYLANLIYNYRMMETAYDMITGMTVDFEALNIENSAELNKTYIEIKSDLVRWKKLFGEKDRHFEFNPGYVCSLYENTEEFENYDAFKFWTEMENTHDWVMYLNEKGKKTDYDLKLSTFLTKDAEGKWGYVPDLICEIPIKGDTADGIAHLDFSYYLRSSVNNLHHNGSNGSYATDETFTGDGKVYPKNNPLKEKWSNTFVVNGRNIYDEELTRDKGVGEEQILELKEGLRDYAFGLYFSTGWQEQNKRRWLDDYWEKPADDNYWSREFVHATLAKFNAFMDALSGLTIKKDTKKIYQYAEDLHTRLRSFGFVHDGAGKEEAYSLKGIQETFYSSKAKAVQMLNDLGLSKKTCSDPMLKGVGIDSDLLFLDAVELENADFQKSLVNATWVNVFDSISASPNMDNTWYVNLTVSGWTDSEGQPVECLLSELFTGMNAQNPLDDKLFMRIWAWFYSYDGQNKTETEVIKYFKSHKYAYPL